VPRKLLLVGVVVLAAAAGAAYYFLTRRPPAALVPGIALSLAERRAARISDLRYEVTYQIPAARSEPIPAHVKATFVLRDTGDPLAFDFAQPGDRLRAMQANRTILTPAVDTEHVVIPAEHLLEGENVVEFDLLAGEAPLNRTEDFLYALFVPARASQSIPVFDQPDLKARWRLILNMPHGWNAVSNGKEVGRVNSPSHLGLVFEETAPIPTYLFTFAAGKFTIDEDVRNGRTFRMFHRETDAAKLARNRAAIYDLHARSLAWLEDYTGIPYAFGKFDFALIPSFQFGGMEHPGAVFYNANSLLLDESATQTQMLGRANLIAHETAHMWFGDLVTMKWFNDVWMKEVFANFMAAKIVNPSFPEVNHELRFLFQHYPAAYDVDRTEGANPIRQDLANLNEAGSLYGAIIYQKAPIVMRQLERVMGETAFRDGLREYLNAHKFGNATWSDLIEVLDAKTGDDLKAWSRAWVEERGRPRIVVSRSRAGTPEMVTLTEEDPLGRRLSWPQQVILTQGFPERTLETVISFRGGRWEQTTQTNESSQWLLPNGRGLGYADFVMETTELDALAKAVPGMTDPLARGAATMLLWESMLEGRIEPTLVMGTLIAALPRESDELNTNQMLDYTRTLFWRFTAADDRPDVGARLEAVLRDGLNRAPSTSQKAAWFNALRSVATTDGNITWLTSVWRRQTKIPQLPLSEVDEAELALELAVRDTPDAAEILRVQHERITNPDRKARFAFVSPALSSDAAVRDAFFAGLKDVSNRRREAWVLEAVRYLHHPLRAAVSRKHVIDALALTLDIQRTGDIFFPKRWADATLWGYQSPQTSSDVRAFIDELPADYPPRLKWVLLASADSLFRAARIVHQ
jgi:aminopeptidase N